MSLPGAILGNVRWQAFDANGDPLAGAKLYSYAAGTLTPLALYSGADLDTDPALSNPVVADGNGRFAAMYMQPQGYDLALKTSADVSVWTCDDVEDIGQSFLANLGDELAAGAKDQASGYTIVATDTFVTMSTTNGANPIIVTLQASADRGLPITIKNKTASTMNVTPNGAETIDGVAGAYTVPAAASPNFPTVTLVPIVSGYLILSSHGI